MSLINQLHFVWEMGATAFFRFMCPLNEEATGGRPTVARKGSRQPPLHLGINCIPNQTSNDNYPVYKGRSYQRQYNWLVR